jgi:hypothetical protein
MARHRAGVPRNAEEIVCDVVGPVCETSDTLGSDRRLPRVDVGDLLAVRDTGRVRIGDGLQLQSTAPRRRSPRRWRVSPPDPARQTVDEMLQWDV